MVKPKDPTLIPRGEYCYQWVDLEPGEVVPAAGSEWGRLQRECAAPWTGQKQVLCPYLELPGYGTVRCLYLREEALACGASPEYVAGRLYARYGVTDAVSWFDKTLLGDLIKVCPFPAELSSNPDHTTHASNIRPQKVWPHFAHLGDLGLGEWIDHKNFGVGQVVDVDYGENRSIATVNFRGCGSKRIDLTVALVRRIAPPAVDAPLVAQAPPWAEVEFGDLGWSWVTGLVGPFGDGFGRHSDSERAAGRRNRSRGLARIYSARVVVAAVPPFKALRGLLHAVLPEKWQGDDALWRALWLVAEPVREPLAPPAWPQGVACRWLDVSHGTLSAVLPDEFQNMLRRRVMDWRSKVQSLRVLAVSNGCWWPAPMEFHWVLAEDGRIGFRLRFAPSYQPPHMPWLVHWVSNPKGDGA